VRVFGFPPVAPDPVGSLEVGEHQDVEQLGAGCGTQCVEPLPESAFKSIGSHGRRLRRRQSRVVNTGTGAKATPRQRYGRVMCAVW
jgi:hypothetical protein